MSASIPAALVTAVPWTSPHHGPRDVLAVGASAGMSFALVRFVAHASAIAGVEAD